MDDDSEVEELPDAINEIFKENEIFEKEITEEDVKLVVAENTMTKKGTF